MASQDTSDLVHTLDSVVCVHHVYKRIWTPTIGEQLQKLACWRTATDTRLEDVHGMYTHSLHAAGVA